MHINIRLITIITLLLFWPTLTIFGEDSYEVSFTGVEESETIALLKLGSQMVSLKDHPTTTRTALKRRAEADIPNFIKIMHSLAYYNAQVDVEIDFESKPPLVMFHIDKGIVYPLVDFKIIPDDPKENTFPYEEIQLKEIGITLNKPAFPKTILKAEEDFLLLMTRKGYPLATIKKREVIADQKTNTISVKLYVNSGPLSRFGPITITGRHCVKEVFFYKKIAWCRGAIYDPKKVERTQIALESSGLFSSISITNAAEAPNGILPMEISVTEAKHRSIEGGLSYSSDNGIGALLGWEDRNMRGLGEKLSFEANIAERLQEGTLLYMIPDYLRPKQDLIMLGEIEHQLTKGFRASSESLSTIIERQVNDRMRISYGLMFKKLRDSHSANNRRYNLLKTPFVLRWSNANNLLDPSKGLSLNLKITPSWQMLRPQFFYCINTFTTGIYTPLTSNQKYVFAVKATLGSIFGANSHDIPPPERYYAGTDSLLRGYRYYTVSPINKEDHHKPIGGRSMMVYSLELRKRTKEGFGWVGFYDFGNVYSSTFPKLNHKILQSVGIGLRYATPVGPIRMDIAFPLSPRRHIDRCVEVYLSIGQAF